MSQEVLLHPLVAGGDESSIRSSNLRSYVPVVVALFGALALTGWRISAGGEHFITDSALVMLALAAYCFAAVFYLTNMHAPFRFAEKFGMWTATLGVFFNLSSWLVRWATAYDHEWAIFNSPGANPADMPWVFRY